MPGDRVDPRFVTFCLEHEYRSLTGHGSFLSPPFFYPVRGTLGYSDVVLGDLPMYSLFRATGLMPFYAMKMTAWSADILCFLLALGFLAKGLGWRLLPSALGAAFYAFNLQRFLAMGQYQMEAGFLLPAAAWCGASWARNLKALGEKTDFRPAAALLLLDLQLLTSYYLGWFALFWGAIWLGFLLMDPFARRWMLGACRSRARDLIVAAVAFVVGLIPFLWIYLPVLKDQPHRRFNDYWTLVPTGADWLKVDAAHPLSGLLHALGADLAETEGLVLQVNWGPVGIWILLAIVAGILWSRLRRHGEGDGELPFLASAAAACLLGALLVTRWGAFSPWRWVFENVPGANSIRSVNRFPLFLSLPAAVFLAWAYGRVGAFLEARRPALRAVGWGLVAVLSACMVYENTRGNWTNSYSASQEWGYLQRFAASVPRDGEAFYLVLPPGAPGSSAQWSVDAAWAALLSGVPTLHGYSGVIPPGWGVYGLKRPEYLSAVEDWVKKNGLKGRVDGLRLLAPDAPGDAGRR